VSTLFTNSAAHAAPPDYFEADPAFAFSIGGKFTGSTPEAAAKAGAEYYQSMTFYPSRVTVGSCTWTYPLPGMGYYACPGEACFWIPDPYTGMPKLRCDTQYSHWIVPVWGRCNTVNQGATPTPTGPVCPDPPPPADTCPVGELTTTHVSYPLNTEDLTQRAKDAVSCLESCSGQSRSAFLSSAYRPSVYQDHLREVWNKWKKLKDDTRPACAALKAKVKKEFDDHGLGASTLPPSRTSCHTEGGCVDVDHSFTETVDFCSTQCSVYRPWPYPPPAEKSDPVHVVPY
jgi:hypothetical protein